MPRPNNYQRGLALGTTPQVMDTRLKQIAEREGMTLREFAAQPDKWLLATPGMGRKMLRRLRFAQS